MKIKLSPNFFIYQAIAVYIVAVLVLYVTNGYTPPSQPAVDVIDNLKPFDNLLPDNTNYQWGSTSFTINKSALASSYGGGVQTVFIGTTSGISCDTCSMKWIATHNFAEAHKRYYIKLLFWKIKNTRSKYWYTDSVKFHADDNQSYLRKVVSAPQTKSNKFQGNYLVDVPVKFMYDQKNQYLLIPVSKSTKKILEWLLYVAIFALVAYLGYLLARFLNFVVDLSRGLAFTDKNISRLKFIAATLILYPVILFLLNLLMKVVFCRYFTADVVMSKSVWENSWQPIGIGLVFLLLYRAFKQGKSLKDEHDLTV